MGDRLLLIGGCVLLAVALGLTVWALLIAGGGVHRGARRG